MKKRIVIGILLVALVLCMALTACQPADDPTTPTDTPTATPTDTPTYIPGDEIHLLNEDGTARYIVIRSDYLTKGLVVDAAVDVRKALSAATNQNFSIETDWVKRGEDMAPYSDIYEILVGETNRPESTQVKETLEGYSYKIAVVGKKIVIIGTGERGTSLAAKCFIQNYLTEEGMKMLTSNTVYTGTFSPEPGDIVLEDKSTGKINPRIVTTKYETEDVVVASIVCTEDGYAVDSTGVADSTAGIQKALNDCAKGGGGTVFLPEGVYSITSSITIPAFVTLRGDWQDPDVGTAYGTVIKVWIENWKPKDNDNPFNEGTFMLGGSGGVYGLTVYYPFQSITNVKQYAPTFYTNGEGNNYMASMVKNCTVINGYLGIGACCKPSGAHEQLTVENFKGTFLYSAAEVYNQADVGTWQNVIVNNKYWAEAAASYMVKADAEALKAYTYSHTVGLKLGDLEWTEFENLQVSDCLIGIQIVEGKRIEFAGSLYDVTIKNCKTGLQVDALDNRWGMVIARSTIEGGIINKTGGAVKLCGVKVSGKQSGSIITDTKTDLTGASIDYLRSYTKVVSKLYVCELDKTGASDVSDALQAQLDEAGKTGGVVYLPGGVYRFDKPIRVPAGVELRGTAAGVTRCQGGDANGTLFYCYYGDTADYSANDTAFITLSGDNAGLNGIRIIYPENGGYDSNLTTTYCVRGTGKNVYVVNCSIAGAAYGIDFRNCDNHFIKKVTTCCYDITFCLGGTNGMLSGCLQNGTVLTRTGARGLKNWMAENVIFDDLFNPILRVRNNYIVFDGAKNEVVFNTFSYGCAVLLRCRNSTDVLAVNLGSDNIGDVQTYMESGSLVTVNTMRYNKSSFEHVGGTLKLYNRLTIGDKNEEAYVKTK